MKSAKKRVQNIGLMHSIGGLESNTKTSKRESRIQLR